MKNEVFVVYSQKLAGYLMINGFKLISLKRNKMHKNYNVFFFAKTDKLVECVETYTGKEVRNSEYREVEE